jgi:hypothetical protein
VSLGTGRGRQSAAQGRGDRRDLGRRGPVSGRRDSAVRYGLSLGNVVKVARVWVTSASGHRTCWRKTGTGRPVCCSASRMPLRRRPSSSGGIGCATDRLRTRRGGRGSHGAGIGRTARQVRRLRAPSDYSPLRARPRCRCRSQERGLMGVRTTGEVAAGAVVTEWRSLLHPKGRGRMD